MKEIHKAKMTASMVMVTDGNGYPTSSSMISVTELNALNGWTNDGKGYIYPRLTSLETEVSNSPMVPDYSAIVTVSGSSYTAPSNGFFSIHKGADSGEARITVNGHEMSSYSADSVSIYFMVPVAKGDSITWNGTPYFIPAK